MLNELTTNGYRIKMLSWDPEAKAFHNVNDVEDEKQNEREPLAPGESYEDPRV